MTDTPHPFNNIPADDADHLLYLIEQAHRPYSEHPINVGDIAAEWLTRWRRAQPRSTRPMAERLNPAFLAIRDAYRPQDKTPAEPEGFSFEQAAKAIEARWPGIRLGQPELDWATRPVIAELHRLRMATQSQDSNRAPESIAYRHRAPEISR